MAALDFAGGDVIGGGVAKDVVQSVSLSDVNAALADDQRQLDLPVQPLGGRCVHRQVVERAGGRGGRLGEEGRELGQFLAVLQAAAALALTLFKVADVVPTHADE